MLDDYLKKIDLDIKKVILNKIKNDDNLRLFLNNCFKLKIKMFEIKDKNIKMTNRLDLVNEIRSLKELYIKSFGVKIFKKYSEDIDNSIRMIDMSFDKLKGKFEILDSLMLFINKYNNNEFENLLNDTTKIKINYSKDVYKNPNVIDFDSSLFITSDDIDIDSENSSNMNLTYHLSNKEKFIDEYSN